MLVFGSERYPGSEFRLGDTPVAQIGGITMSPALKEAVFESLGVEEQGRNLFLRSSRPDLLAARYNRGIVYLAAGYHVLGAESGGHEDPIGYSMGRMAANPLEAGSSPTDRRLLSDVGLEWAAEHPWDIPAASAATKQMITMARLMQALQVVNNQHGLNSVDLEAPPGSLSVDACNDGELKAVVRQLGGGVIVFASNMPTISGRGDAGMLSGHTTEYGFSSQRTHVEGVMPRPFEPATFPVPASL